jgi:hypothetical protein
MIYVMMTTGAALKTAATPLGILDLEFAYNEIKAVAVVNAWASAGSIAAAKINTWWDFVFLFFYSFFLFFACKKIAANLKGMVSKAGNMIANASLLAGFFDILENSGMLYTLNGSISDSVAFLTAFFSVVKWILVIIAVLYVLTGTLVLGYRKFMT